MLNNKNTHLTPGIVKPASKSKHFQMIHVRLTIICQILKREEI